MPSVTPPDVYPLTTQWTFSVSADNVTGTRVYLEVSPDPYGGTVTSVPLPKIGDAWDSDNTNLTLKSITKTFLSENPNCGTVYTCSYDGQPYVITVVNQDEDDLPKGMDISGELISWEPPAGGNNNVLWDSDSKKVDQPVFKSVANATIRINRIISHFTTYTNMMFVKCNKINSIAFLGFPIGTVLFNGGNFAQFTTKLGKTKWRVELNFTVRGITLFGGSNLIEDSWNNILRNDNGKWDIPLVDGDKLYDSTTFTDLFESDVLDDDDDLYNELPLQ